MPITIVSLALLMIAASAYAVAQSPDARIAIDATKKFQQIEGFGASGAWWSNYADTVSPEQQQHMLELLFSDKGAHLSIFRYNIPAGSGDDVLKPERRTPSIETAPFQYDLARDAKALGYLKQVRQLGVQRFVFFANSPPARLTRNGKTSGGDKGGSNLRPDAVDDFARYLVDVSVLIKKQYDLPEVMLSPINEPQWKWGEKWRGQEGCHYTPEEAVPVYRAVIKRLRAADPSIRIEGPESGDWKSAMKFADAIFGDPQIAKEFDSFAIHSYWSNADHKRKFIEAFAAKYPTKQVTMTEFCEMEHGQDRTIAAGLRLARVMHDDLTIGRVVSWQWWLAIGAGGYEDGLVYVNAKTKAVEISHRLWVMGQWSRFVRPGATRVEVSSPEPLRATAFLSADGQSLACVVINDTDRPVETTTPLTGFESKSRHLYVTDQTRQIESVDVGRDKVVFPPRSVSTLVLSQ